MTKSVFNNNIVIGLLALFLFLVSMFGKALISPPELRASNTQEEFNTNRALEHITNIVGDENPHPVGTPQNDRVRERLLSAIKSLGFKPEVKTMPTCFSNGNGSFISCTTVKNVSFRMGPAPVQGKHETILATSHYDSVPAGPGIADAKLGVGVLLETAYHLSKQDLSRPILFLITDGEEGGLFGARAFAEQDPRADEIDIVVNFEARGVEGPAFMFETSQPNGAVIPPFMKAATRPVANSMMTAIYERLPNSTDVAIYLRKGWKALNFAIIGREAYYHTPYDNLKNLSRSSIQHMGDLGLSTMRQLATTEVSKEKNRLIYTDIFGRGMIAMPEGFAIPIMGVALILSLVGFRFLPNLHHHNISIFTYIRVFTTPLIIIIAAGILGFSIQWFVNAVRPEPDYWRAHGWTTHGWATLAGLLSDVVLAPLIAKGTDRLHLFAASWFWFSGIGLAAAILLPGASILFVLPAILFSIGIIVGLTFSPACFALELMAAVLALILLTPIIATLGVGLGYGIAFIISILTAINLLPWLAALKLPTKQQRPVWMSPLPLCIITILGVFIILSCLLPAYSVDNPRHLNVITYIDKNAEKAWLTFGGGDNPPPKEMLAIENISEPKNLIPEFNNRNWHREIQIPTSLPTPSLQIINDIIDTKNNRRLSLRITPSSADRVTIYIPMTSAPKELSYGSLNYPIAQSENREYAIFRCAGRDCSNEDITLLLGGKNDKDANFFIYSEHFGARGEAIPFVNARPPHATARQSGDRTLVFNRQDF